MVRRYEEKRSIWPKLLGLIVICILIGGAVGYFGGYFQSQRITRLLAPSPEKPAEPAASTAVPLEDLSRLSREDLEREVKRLNNEVRARDRQIGDLTIRLKIATSGSHTKDK